MKSKYIEIRDAGTSETGLTRIWHVVNVRTGALLCGEIRWYGGFRKYVFYPETGFLFDSECLAQITEKLQEVNIARKEERKVVRLERRH